MKNLIAVSLLFLSVAALAAPTDNWITFGLDRATYLDGAAVADGEEFALVWTDEAAVTNEVLRLALAEDGFCPVTLFNVTPAQTGGRFLIYQQDTRETGAAGAKLVATAEVATERVVKAELVRTLTPVTPGEAVSVATAEDAAALPIEIVDAAAKAAGQEEVVVKDIVLNPETGKYDVTLVINTASEKFVAPETTVAEFAIAGLAAIAENVGDVTVELPADKVTPGLYYSVEYADNVRLTGATETARSLATAAGVTIRVPKIEAATQFFRIAVNLTAR